MNTKVATILVGVTVLMCGLAIARYTSSRVASEELLDVTRYKVLGGTYPSEAEWEDLHRIMHFGEELSTPYAYEHKGSINAFYSGVQHATGHKQIIVTLQEAVPDLAVARLYVNDVLKKTATRANGGIEDVAGQATATLSVFVLPSNLTSMELVWEDDFGTESAHRAY